MFSLYMCVAYGLRELCLCFVFGVCFFVVFVWNVCVLVCVFVFVAWCVCIL